MGRVGVATRRPPRPAPVYLGRSYRSRIGSLKEARLVFARSGPMHIGGPDRQTIDHEWWTLSRRLRPLPSLAGKRGEKGEKGIPVHPVPLFTQRLIYLDFPPRMS